METRFIVKKIITKTVSIPDDVASTPEEAMEYVTKRDAPFSFEQSLPWSEEETREVMDRQTSGGWLAPMPTEENCHVLARAEVDRIEDIEDLCHSAVFLQRTQYQADFKSFVYAWEVNFDPENYEEPWMDEDGSWCDPVQDEQNGIRIELGYKELPVTKPTKE